MPNKQTKEPSSFMARPYPAFSVQRQENHGLVHVIQWRLLGPERFLALYADGLERLGYRNSPLEAMAFTLQKRFDREAQPFSVEAACRTLLLRPERLFPDDRHEIGSCDRAPGLAGDVVALIRPENVPSRGVALKLGSGGKHAQTAPEHDERFVLRLGPLQHVFELADEDRI